MLAETILAVFCQQNQFFRLVETYFSMNASFPLVETNFLVSTNDKLFSLSSGNVFFNECFIPAIGEEFSL